MFYGIISEMDFKIWYGTILSWVNSLGLPCNINRFEQVKQNVVEEIIKIIQADSGKSIISFINETFPNFVINETPLKSLTDKDYLLICTLILIYVCFTNKDELEGVKQKMCTKLENSVQENIAEFLMNIQQQGDVFSITSKIITEEVLKFSQRHSIQNSASGDGIGTPVKTLNMSANCNSPLLEFLQTPKRKSEAKQKISSSSYSNSDQLKKIKELTDQLVEEELEKASLQERLMWHEMKCNDYELKLKNKIGELEQMKSEWQQEVSNNENQIQKYCNTIEKNKEEKTKLCKELNYLETYASSLEKELSNISKEKKILEEQLKCSLTKVDEYNEEIKQMSKINFDLEGVIKAKEDDLQMLKETLMSSSRNETFEPCMDDTLDCSEVMPENMGIVIEKLLRERTLENETLKEAIDTMKSDKECLTNEISMLRSQLSAKTSENAQLQQLNKELVRKIDGFVKTCKDIQNIQKKVFALSQELDDGDRSGLSLIRKTDAMNVFEIGNLRNLLDSGEPVILTLFNESDSKELHVIYDSSKDLTDSASQFSLEDNDTTQLTTIMESLNESEDGSSHSSSAAINEANNNVLENFKMEELNQEIITAKKSLIAFLRASMKNFEVLKVKENLINEMSKQHEHLQSRITSLTELNTRLTKEIVNSKNISQVDSEFKEKELDKLKVEVESLKKASNVLKEKLAVLEKTNEVLVNKKEEYLSELALLRERNKTLNNDLQNKVMTQLKQQSSCVGFIRNKQETGLELERTLKIKDDIGKRFLELRKQIAKSENKIQLEITLNSVEQKFYVTCQNLLHTTYSCLKWSAKSMEHQYFLIGQGDILPDNDISENSLKKEQEENREKLKQVTDQLNGISEELDSVEAKCNETYLSDSLEIISTNNKTFDTINLDEKYIHETTFSIKKEEVKISDDNTLKENNSAWVISPPSKANRTVEIKNVRKDKPSQGESWVIPLSPPQKLSQTQILSNQQSGLLRTESSYASALENTESDSRQDIKKSTSAISFASAADSVVLSQVSSTEDLRDSSKETSSGKAVPFEFKLERECAKEWFTESEYSLNMWQALKNKVSQLQKELIEAMEENKRLKIELAECEEKHKQDRENLEKRQKSMKENITTEYENQLEHLKSEMKALYNRELAKHKSEQSKLAFELREQNKIYKDHVDDLRNQLWNLGEKLLQEQKIKRDLERNLEEMKKKYSRMYCLTELESKSSQDSDILSKKERLLGESYQTSCLKQFGSASFPIIPNEDEDEVFDNRCLEDMKAGICKVEGPEGRLTELKYRNSLCLPHLKSSYPVETQFHNPKLYKENDLLYGALNFGQESQSLTDSDHSMTRSLLPQDHGKKKEQTSYKKPGPPTPSKNGRRLSTQSGEVHATPRKVLRESNGSLSDRKSTPGRIKSLFSAKSVKRDGVDQKDENTVPVTSRGKKLRIFPSVKPFGGRDY